jgi:hypothetical protein
VDEVDAVDKEEPPWLTDEAGPSTTTTQSTAATPLRPHGVTQVLHPSSWILAAGSFFGFDKAVRPSFLYPILMVSLKTL